MPVVSSKYFWHSSLRTYLYRPSHPGPILNSTTIIENKNIKQLLYLLVKNSVIFSEARYIERGQGDFSWPQGKRFLVKLTNKAGVFVDGQFGDQGIILGPDLGLKITRFVLDLSWFQIIGVSPDVIPYDGFGILFSQGSLALIGAIAPTGHSVSPSPVAIPGAHHGAPVAPITRTHHVSTGMMGMMGRTDDLQAIMNSITTIADIHFVALVDREGKIIAHNDERLVGSLFPRREKIRQLTGREGPISWFEKEGEFIVLKKMEPFHSMGMGGNTENSMWFRMRSMMAPQGTLLDKILSGQVYAVAGLGTKAYEEARKNDLRHAIMMGVILLVLGTAGFYFIFLVQDYYITQRALDSITTYANQVVENMPSGLLSIDPDGNIVTLNNRAKEILALKGELPEREEIKKSLLSFFEPIRAGKPHRLFSERDRKRGDP